MHVCSPLHDNVLFDHPRRKPLYNCWNYSFPASVVRNIYKYFLFEGHGDIKTGSTCTRQAGGNVEFGTIRAYFDVGKCSNRLGILENLGVAVGIAFLPCSHPNL